MRGKIGIIIILICSLLLSACGEKNASGSKDTQVDSIHTTIVGGRTGGAWSVFTEGIAESIRRNNDGAVVTVEPGGIVDNPASVGLNKVPYGMSYAMTAYAAYKGEEPYKKPYKDLRAVAVVIPANYYQFLVRADSGYDSLEDVAKNHAPIRLSVDQKGSAGEIITRNILKAYGMTYQNIKDWGGSVDHLSDAKTFELMADRRIDATGDAISVPSGDIVEASTTIDFNMLSIDHNVMQKVADNLGMETGVIKAGSYDFLKTDIQTLFTPAILIVNKDVPDDEVYQITKSIYDNFDYLKTVHKEFQNLTEKNIADVGKIPLHPGAKQFFKEHGLLEDK